MTTRVASTRIKCQTEKCNRLFHYPSLARNHQRTCTGKPDVRIKRKVYGRLQNDFEDLRKLFPPDWELSKDVTTFDIETFEKEENGQIKLKLLSIAAASTLVDKPQYFVRTSSDPKAAWEMVNKFMDYLCMLHKKKLEQIPDYVIKKVEEVNKLVKERPFDRKLYSLRAKLKKCVSLSCFSFNGGKFDMQLLIVYIVLYGMEKKWSASVLKKGTAFLSVEIGPLHFKGK